MGEFAAMLPALVEGESVRRIEWEPFVRMFVSHDHLMCQCGSTIPWHHSLTWAEITASDWHPIQAEPGDEQRRQASVVPAPIPHVPERGFRNLFNGSAAHYKLLLLALFLKWWNSD
jgi:hypothetical protein